VTFQVNDTVNIMQVRGR